MNSEKTAEFQFDQSKKDFILKNFGSPFRFRMAMLSQLPMGWLSGMRVKELTEKKCTVVVRYKWLNKNPFASTFWAVLGMAAEMSSGALVMVYTFKQKPSVATIITGTTAVYHKKAVGKTYFTCESGDAIENAVLETMRTGESVEVVCPMKGVDEKGELIAEFTFTWSFKKRRRS